MKRRSWILGLVVLAGAGWYLFRPELLFMNKRVNESLPIASASTAPSEGAKAPTIVLTGRFHSVAHETRGTASVHELGDGSRVLRLTDFATSNGPDVRVYLIAAPDASDNATVTKSGYLELGKLKGNEGDQNYEIPAGTDLTRYHAVTIWCHRFNVNFATAPLTQGAPAATKFTIKVENISNGEVLKLSNGKTAPFVSAPVLWAVHTGSTNPIFVAGRVDAGKGLETLAETGNPGPLAKSLDGATGVVAVDADDRPVGSDAGGPIPPGKGYQFEVTAAPGQTLSLAWMFGQSNDLFYSNDRPIALFDATGKPVSGDMTRQLALWDAGTEVNEEPGLGPNQGPRQKTSDAGITEHQGIAHVHDRFSYPRTTDVLRLTITPDAGAMSSR
jgi:Electron transfer DM13